MKRALALCLTILLTVQVCAFSASAKPSDTYTGTILAAINTNYDDLTQGFTAESPEKAVGASGVSPQADEEPSPENWIDGVLSEDPVPLSPDEARRKEASLGNAADAAPKAEYRVGDRKQIRSLYRDDFDTSMVDLECIYINDRCTVWREDGCSKSPENCIALADTFSEMIPKELALFGDYRIDADGDGRIALVFNEMNDVGGYFWSTDLVDDSGRIGSVWVNYKSNGNVFDCIHLYPYADINTILHEYQHYLHCSWKYAGKNNLTCVDNSHESYINEGFSGCAEALLGSNDRSPGFAYAANRPDAYSLVNWSFDSSSYAMSYVFCQYLRTRYALLTNDLDSEIPGGGVFREIQKIRRQKYVRSTLSIAADLLYPKAQYPDLKTTDSRCRALLEDFWLAVLRKEKSGIHGFNGEAWAKNITVNIQDSMPPEDGAFLRSGMAVFCRIPSPDPLHGVPGSVQVTSAGKQLRFFGVSGAGNRIIFDWRDARIPNEFYMTTESTFRQKPAEDLRIADRVFLGWAADPNSEKPDYSIWSTIPLSADMTTMYAVWTDTPILTAGTTVRLPRYALGAARFTPETDGFYVFEMDSDSFCLVDAEGAQLEPEWTDYYGMEQCLALQAGQTVSLCFTSSSYSRVSVKRVEQQFTLRYISMLNGETYTEEVRGGTKYLIGSPCKDILSYADQHDLLFLGWAETADAAQAEYTVNDTISLQEDTTLYAVWRPISVLQTETDNRIPLDQNAVRLPRCNYVFTPQTDGTYRFSFPAPAACIAEEEEQTIYLIVNEENGVSHIFDLTQENGNSIELSLRKGRKYSFNHVYVFGHTDCLGSECTVRVEKISDAPSARLIYSIPEDAGTLFDAQTLETKTGFVYTVPDWSLAMKKPKALVGWSEHPDDPDERIYRPGDKIELISDLTLYPVWKPVQQTRVNTSNAAYLWRVIRCLFRMLRIYVSDALFPTLGR